MSCAQQKKLSVKPVFFLFIFAIFCSPVYGEVSKGDFAIGLNYPGFGMRYFLSDKTSIEAKGQIDKKIGVYGLRTYYYFNPKSQFLFLSGLEGDYVTFEGKDSKGVGFAGEIFAGGEFFFTKSLSLQMDLGPAFVALKDKNMSESASGFEYVANFGLNYYFGK